MSVATQVPTPFTDILRRTVEAVPGAIGGAFAASDGEMVDAVSTQDIDDWRFLTAHYGVVLAHVQSALNTLHYGSARYVILRHEHIDVLVHAVGDGYFSLLAVAAPAPLALALDQLSAAAGELRQEMM